MSLAVLRAGEKEARVIAHREGASRVYRDTGRVCSINILAFHVRNISNAWPRPGPVRMQAGGRRATTISGSGAGQAVQRLRAKSEGPRVFLKCSRSAETSVHL